MKFSTMALASTLALGLTCAAQASGDSFTGAYAGVKLGYGKASIKNNATTGSKNYTSNAINGDLFIGYGQTFDMAYAGIEGFVGSDNQSKTLVANSVSYKSDLTYGLNARLGVVVVPTAIIYVSCAGAQVKDKYTVAGVSTSKNKFAVIPGIGAELMIPNTSFSARLDGTYQLPVSTSTSLGTFKTSKTTVKLGLAYRF